MFLFRQFMFTPIVNVNSVSSYPKLRSDVGFRSFDGVDTSANLLDVGLRQLMVRIECSNVCNRWTRSVYKLRS